MIEQLIRTDQQWLLWLNGHHSPFFDQVMYFISGKYEWIPLYLVLFGILIWKFRWKALWILLAVVVLITLADQFANLFKDGIRRYRPCKDPEIGHMVHLVNNYCRSSYGFVSGHAANSFALATFLSLLLRNKWFTVLILFWAALVSYSRIYLGVHYPGDILAGAILGALLAWMIYYILKRFVKLHPASTENPG